MVEQRHDYTPIGLDTHSADVSETLAPTCFRYGKKEACLCTHRSASPKHDPFIRLPRLHQFGRGCPLDC